MPKLFEYPHYWWWIFRQAVHERHVWASECPLERRVQDDAGQWTVVIERGAIERCACGKGREVWG